MTTQPVEANVVLTADNSQYDQAMMASAGSTDQLGKSLDSLGQKITSLTKAAGKTLIGISAADVALIGSATAAWASYEKQMSRLQAQSAILTRTNSQQERTMKDYTAAVKTLRTEYGSTTSEAAKLVEVLSKVTDMRQTRQMSDLSKVFTDMSKATGESSEGLASSLTNLQKIMGSPINTKSSREYADTFTYLSAKTNTSAQGLIDFTAQIAPMAQQMGMNGKQIAGFATGITRAGQEGYAAGNVFNKITGDITKAIASGGPELKQYANIVGVTVDSFQKMDSAEQVLRIFEALNNQGSRALVTYERLGLEGPKSMRAVAAISREPGGLRASVADATSPAAVGTAAEGAAEAMDNLNEKFTELREELRMTAEGLAEHFGPMVTAFVGGIEKMAENVNQVMSGPFGDFIQMIMGVVAPLAGGAGAMLLFAGAILKVAAAFAVWRNSMSLGMREGFRGAGRIGGAPEELGPHGAQIAGADRPWQRRMYNLGQPIGAAFGGGTEMGSDWGRRARSWIDPNYQPGPRRSIASYLAGGTGRAIDWMVTPQFDQMRYSDPTKRADVMSKMMPWASAADRTRLSGAMGGVAAAQGGLTTAEAVQQSVLGAQGVSPEMQARAKDEVEQARARLSTAKETERVTKENISATRAQTREVNNNATGFNKLGRSLLGLGAGAGGGLVGGGVAGGRMAGRWLRDSGMGANLAGGVGMAALGATGNESSSLMFASMGATMGGVPGAAVGFAAGAALDMAAANDEATASVERFQDAANEFGKSGTGIAAMGELNKETAKDVQDLDKSFKDVRTGWKSGEIFPGVSLGMLTDTKAYFGGMKNDIKGLFGDSDIDVLEKDQKRAQDSVKRTEDTVRALAKASGVEITGTKEQQITKLEDFMATTGAQRLEESGTDIATLTAQRAVGGLFGLSGDNLIKEIASPGTGQDLDSRLRASGGIGAALTTGIGAESLAKEGDIALATKATNDIFNTAVSSGKSYLKIMKEAESAQNEVGVENSRQYEMLVAISQMSQQAMQVQAPQLGRVGAFRQTLQIGQGLAGLPTEGMTAEQQTQVQNAKAANVAAVGDQISYFRQMLLAQDQYELQRSRAQEDYHETRMYQEQDYNLSRERAEESFNRQRGRAIANFQRQQERATYQFNLSRRRAEDDFNHQVNIQAKQQAAGVFDIYQRVQTERTSSIEWIVSNAKDQVQRIQEMTGNLDILRGRGVSDTAIQQLGLTDPKNAQQLGRIVSETVGAQGAEIIAQLNAVTLEKVGSSKTLMKDPSSMEWQEMERGFKKSMTRGAEDFDLQMKESKQDFNRGLRENRTDFNIMMEQQAQDYEKGMRRQERAYKKSMDRSAEDMANMANEILLTNEQVLTESTQRLTGAAQTQAIQVEKSLKHLKRSTKPEAIALMTDLAAIFGFEYTKPKSDVNSSGDEMITPGGRSIPVPHADGGVLPGWSPGRDDRMVSVSGGEAIMRPEWARKVGKDQIDAMNHAAKHGGFADGGIPAVGDWTQHPSSQYPWARWAGDINIPGSSDYGNPVRAYEAGIVAAVTYLGDRSYGRYITINHPELDEQTLYAHLSAASVKAGDTVTKGQQIGNVGDLGNTTGPHLHFEIKGGTAPIVIGSGGGGGLLSQISTQVQAMTALKKLYPKAEEAAWEMEGAHPLGPGKISKVINRLARAKIKSLIGQGLTPGLSDTPEGIPPEPSGMSSNQETVQKAMLAAGFGQGQWSALYNLVTHESGFNNMAQNPNSTAFGMFQFLDSTWAGVDGKKTSDPWLQAVYGMRYIKNRYKNPKKAWDFWQDNNWYGEGAVFNGAQTIGVGESGPEAVIPLNENGMGFMANVMARSVGMGSSPMAGGSTYNTKIDKSTNFTGPITVQAQNPEELLNKLQQRARVMALSRPTLTGSAA